MTPDAQPPEPARRGRGRGRPSTLDRESTLGAAWRVIAARGLDRARYTDIARESGTPVSTLQNAFGTLDALLNQAVDYASARDDAILTDVPGPDDATPVERLEALVDGGMGTGTREDMDAWLVWLELWRAAARDTTLASHTARAYTRWWDTAESIVEHGQRTGEFTDAFPARDLAVGVVALLDGSAVAMVLRATDPDPAEARRITLLGARKLLAP
ncbi:MAG: TetR family transcriptional regulator C-terminal domain-containing protein [Solirubrobacteraceae bacterium]|nr:TetR family transcriptional regulator C-terminal domain-containing protein [Patulibacter sp.]